MITSADGAMVVPEAGINFGEIKDDGSLDVTWADSSNFDGLTIELTGVSGMDISEIHGLFGYTPAV